MNQPRKRLRISRAPILASLIAIIVLLIPTPFVGTVRAAGHHSTARAEPDWCTDTNDPDPTHIDVTQVPIEVTSTTADYFVLYVQFDDDGDEWEFPVLVKQGEDGTTSLAENVEALGADHYRVEKYLVNQPADVDGDCIDDITELNDQGPMNPVNPTGKVAPLDGAVSLPDADSFPGDYARFVIVDPLDERPGIYFINSKTHPLHNMFTRAVGIQGVARGLLSYHPSMTNPNGELGVYSYWTIDSTVFKYAERIHTVMAANLPLLDDNLALYLPNADIPIVQDELPTYRESRIDLVFDEDIYPDNFLSLNEGEGYGRLRVMKVDERPHPRDVVIYETLPSEMPKVAGIISTALQTPLSHVNLRAVQDKIPNAFIRTALDNTDVTALKGSYVHYRVTSNGWSLSAATKEQVDAHYASTRPTETQTPVRDLSVTTITPLSAVGFNDWTAFGVKAANLSVLGRLGFPQGTVPDGFAIPFYFYDEFMKHNELYAEVEEMLADEDFQASYDEQNTQLKALRSAIKQAETPAWIKKALTEMHATYPEGQSLRYRSSTNNEDLPHFNGAGLYDSKTQKPTETEVDGIDKSFKQVLAGLWTFRAFTERDFHRIDHMATSMGVLVHPNYSDELANGVAVSLDLNTGIDGYYYVNTQLGEDLVTLPQPNSVPEELLVGSDGLWYVLAISNLVEPGALLMNAAQINQLYQHLTTIHDRFNTLYGPSSGDPFAMEIEFKITSADILAIKQARPWVFSGTPSRTPATAPTITTTGVPSPYLEHGTGTVSTFRAQNPGNRSVSWAVTGTDGDAFDISSSGALTFSAAPDFEAPTDSNGDNEYEIAVVVINDLGLTNRLNVTVTVTNDTSDDPQALVQFDQSSYAVAEGESQLITVTLTAAVAQEVEIPITTTNEGGASDADYSGVPPTVTFTPGQVSATFSFTAIDDTDDDDHESVLLSFGPLPAELGAGTTNEVRVSITTNTPATGAPTVSGTAQVGETLTASTSGIADEDGLTNVSYLYQWVRNDGTDDSDIGEATANAYTLVAADQGKTVKVRVSFSDDVGNAESLTSAATAAVAARPGNPATGAPAISGTAQVGETLTANTTGIADSDGLTTVSYAYQWTRNDGTDDSDISGATDSTYTLVSDDQGKTVKVSVSFTDDAGNSESLTSAATAAVAAAQSALTASSHEAPESHDGSASFTFELHFSEEFPISYVTLRDHAFTVTEGAVVNARRLEQGRNDRWEITVRPEDDGDVTVVLPVTTDCTANGGICDDNDRKLSNEVSLTVSGPSSNNPATGGPAISGTAQVGETLTTATSGIADTDGMTGAVFSYQWLADDSEISGATGSSYTLVAADQGKTIKVRVSFTDDAGHAESLTSPATNSVAPRPNTPASGGPAISGTAQVGETLTTATSGIADTDGMTGAAFSYQWLADDSEISGATGSSYTLAAAEQGKTIKVRVSFTDDAGHAESLTSPATNSVAPRPNTPATGGPAISGTAQVGETLTAATSGIADTDGMTGAAFSYQWLADDSEISGATGSSYTLAAAEQGKTIRVRVSFTDDAGHAELLTSPATNSVAPRPNTPATGGPAISGTAQVGETLTTATSGIADTDGMTGAAFSYQWLADDSEISGATGSSYTLAAADQGKTIKVRVSFTDDAGHAESLTSPATNSVAPRPNTPATGGPAISGTAQVGETLTTATNGIADTDGMTGAAFSYQWLADDSEISGATGSSYTLVAADQGKTIKVRVSFTDDAGHAESLTSPATNSVAPRPNTPATGGPAISGTAQVGETLTAATSGIADTDGMTGAAFSYQWLADDSEISGATGSSYTLAAAEQGKTIRVRVSFTDDAGNAESLTSSATNSVAPRPNSPATGLTSIRGTVRVGETLTPIIIDYADADGMTGAAFSYQWLADDSEISGATGSSYTLAAADQGKTIRVRVSFTDDAGNAESLTSPATASVAAAWILTASAHFVPASHDGSSTFIFQLRFSEEPRSDFSYQILRDHAFSVTGGEVVKARRLLRPGNTRWEITVQPSGDGMVTIVLPPTTDCDTEGAICTGDGRMLSNRITVVVAGP